MFPRHRESQRCCHVFPSPLLCLLWILQRFWQSSKTCFCSFSFPFFFLCGRDPTNVLMRKTDKVTTFCIQKFKSQLHCDLMMFCINTSLAVIQCHNSEREIMPIFGTELATLIRNCGDCRDLLCCGAEDIWEASTFVHLKHWLTTMAVTLCSISSSKMFASLNELTHYLLTFLVHHKLIAFTDIGLQEIVLAPCDEAFYKSSVLLCENRLRVKKVCFYL